EASQDVHRGRLARTRWPHHRDKITAFDGQVDALQRLKRSGAFPEGLCDLLQFDDRTRRHRAAALIEVTTFMPVFSLSDVSTVYRPSLWPVTTSIGSRVPSARRTWTVWRHPPPIVGRPYYPSWPHLPLPVLAGHGRSGGCRGRSSRGLPPDRGRSFPPR